MRKSNTTWRVWRRRRSDTAKLYRSKARTSFLRKIKNFVNSRTSARPALKRSLRDEIYTMNKLNITYLETKSFQLYAEEVESSLQTIFDALTWVMHRKISLKSHWHLSTFHCLRIATCTTWLLARGSLGTRTTVALVDFKQMVEFLSWKVLYKIMAESFDFTEEEIRRKLEQLGYSNIPSDKLKLFQRGLFTLLCRFNECMIDQWYFESVWVDLELCRVCNNLDFI